VLKGVRWPTAHGWASGRLPLLPPFGLVPSGWIWLGALGLLVAHLALSQDISLPALVPQAVADWVVSTFKPDIPQPVQRLSALIVLAIGSIGVLITLRRKSVADLPQLDLPGDWREKHPYVVLLGFGIFCVAAAVIRFSSGAYSSGLVVLFGWWE